MKMFDGKNKSILNGVVLRSQEWT